MTVLATGVAYEYPLTDGKANTAPEMTRKTRPFPYCWLLVLMFLLIYAFTFQDSPGDSALYQVELFRYAQTHGSHPTLLWEFGHLLWRPLTYSLWRITSPATARWCFGNDAIEINCVLFGINFLAGLCLSPLTFNIGRKIGLRPPAAFLIALGLLLCSVTLNYIHCGTAYLPGLALQLAGICLLLRGLEQRRRYLYAACAGVVIALSVTMWFVYVLAVPAALLVAAILPLSVDHDGRTWNRLAERARFVAVATTAAALTIASCYVLGALICHITTASELRDWIVSSGHSITADKRLLRFPAGLTRSFLYLAEEGKILKRFVFGDPYAPVTWLEFLVKAGIWKIAFMMAACCSFIWALVRSNDKTAFAIALAGVIPTLWFAVFVFETSQSERYLPFYPALIVALCILLKQANGNRNIGRFAGLFLLVLAVVNLKAYAIDVRTAAQQSLQRMRLVYEHSQPDDVTLILSQDDPLAGFSGKHPFDAMDQGDEARLYMVMDIRHDRWNAAPSCRVLRAWQAGANAWISKRLIASQPLPSWDWIENDNPAVHWRDLAAFFNRLDTNADIGSEDGFLRVARSAHNAALLEQACANQL